MHEGTRGWCCTFFANIFFVILEVGWVRGSRGKYTHEEGEGAAPLGPQGRAGACVAAWDRLRLQRQAIMATPTAIVLKGCMHACMTAQSGLESIVRSLSQILLV